MKTYLLSILLLVILIGIFYICSKNTVINDTFEDIYEEKYEDDMNSENINDDENDYEEDDNNDNDNDDDDNDDDNLNIPQNNIQKDELDNTLLQNNDQTNPYGTIMDKDSVNKEDITEKTDAYKSEVDNEIDLTFNEIKLDPHPLDLQINTHHILTLKRNFDDMITDWYNKNKDTVCQCQDLM